MTDKDTQGFKQRLNVSVDPLDHERSCFPDFDPYSSPSSGYTLRDYLDRIAAYNNSLYEANDQPNAPGSEFRSPLWEFCYWAKTHPELTGLNARTALEKIWQWLRARGCGGWPEAGFTLESDEDGDDEFYSVWDRIKYAPGDTPLTVALRRADDYPFVLLPEHSRTPRYARFVSMAAWLQIDRGNDDIFLPCEIFGKILDCSPKSITNYRRWSQQDGFLRKCEPHRREHRRATTFRFDLTRFNPKTRIEHRTEQTDVDRPALTISTKNERC